MLKVLTEFHNWAVPQITGMTAKCGAGRDWEYQAVEEAMDYLGLHPMRVYINRRQETIAKEVVCWSIYSLYMEVYIIS